MEPNDTILDELTEALGYARKSITWQRGLDLVRETIQQRNAAREDAETHRQRWRNQAATIAKYQERPGVRDLESQVAALQKAIDEVWALVEKPDGYGSPYWTSPGIDDTTPAGAIGWVLAHLRMALSKARGRMRVFEERNATQADTIAQYQAVLERMLRDRVKAEAGIERLRPYAGDVSVESHFPDLAAIIAALVDPSTAPR